ncbi:Ldh family oxidoreductase [Pantoea cypripedii]|uniref:Sulfolactate dehydrogenase n=1 Tax=Pantoea cypripedii TaxID=55209 RepID=A0A6B9GAM3_PANCY|nr:Ldh family oxidoreductase [Pantoea cypripedii]QGY32873.1 sulfolactate dehydrogenase [Pantoea cypripedii]
MSHETLALTELEAIARRALCQSGVDLPAAEATCAALMAAERAGIASHGFARLPYYLDQLDSGKLNPRAVPTLTQRGAVVNVNADSGLAFPAVQRGLDRGMVLAQEFGVVAVAIGDSHHFGMAGYYAEQAARQGLVCIALSNGPAAMAPWGGNVPLYGTTPIAFASPRASDEPLVIDLSLSEVARGKIMLASQKKEAIPSGWAIDRDGNPTCDADAALAGSMAPAGGAKGAALALMVELLTAGLTGSHYGFQASSFFNVEGGAPHIAQLLLLLNPAFFSAGYVQHTEMLFSAMLAQPNVRLPGERRQATARQNSSSLSLPASLLEQLRFRAG